MMLGKAQTIWFVVALFAGCGPSATRPGTLTPGQQGPQQGGQQGATDGPQLGNSQDGQMIQDQDQPDLNPDTPDSSNDQNDVIVPGPGPDTDSTPVDPILSNGSGGQTGEIEVRFSASNGKSSTYKTTIPSDISANKSYGLNIHLHGDGGGDYDWLYRPNVRIAAEHGLIGIVVLAPNTEKRWYRDGMANAKFLDELIQNELFKKYNIDKTRVYFSGVSGGSQFLTGQFIPTYGANYNSGAVLLCGGPKNWQNSINSNQEFLNRFNLYWYSHTGDFLYDQIEAGISYYTQLGMNVDSEIINGGSHCKFSEGISGALERKLPLVLH